MEFRYVGNSGFKISEITYGNWLTHGSQVENDRAKACVRAALDAGITTFDTADVYANTRAETVLGEALKGERRESLEILTKVYWPTGRVGTTTSAYLASTSWSRSWIAVPTANRLRRHLPGASLRLRNSTRGDHAGVRGPGTDGQGALCRRQRVDRTADPGRIRSCRGTRLHLISNQPQYSMLRRVIEADVVPASLPRHVPGPSSRPSPRVCSPESTDRVSSRRPDHGQPTRRAART